MQHWFGVGDMPSTAATSHVVNPETATYLAPVFAALRHIVDFGSTLPISAYRRSDDGTRRRITPPQLISGLDAEGEPGTVAWLGQAFYGLAAYGNAVGWIRRVDGLGYPTAVSWLSDSDWAYSEITKQWYVFGQQVPSSRIVHIPWIVPPGKKIGLSPIEHFASMISAGMSAQEYADMKRGGGIPPSVLKNSEKVLDAKQAAEVKSRLVRSLSKGEPFVTGRDWDYTAITIPPNHQHFIETLKLSANQTAAIYGIDATEIGGEAANSLTYCADTETEILTDRGWRRWDEVVAGDICLTLNTETQLGEWQPIETVNVFDGPHQVLKLRSGAHSSVTTPDHRWPTIRQGRMRWRTTDGMTSADRILAAAPVVNGPAEQKWSDALVELVAWHYTEGWVGRYGEISIAQSHAVNPQNCARIRACLTEVFGPCCEEKYVRSRPAWVEDASDRVTHFRINKMGAEVLRELAPEKVPTVEFLASLTRSQLELFIQTSIDADGSVNSNGTPMFAQKDRRRVEAFQVACNLTGRSGVIRQQKSGMWLIAVTGSALRAPKAHGRYIATGTIAGPVWCPTTSNGTWFARRDGTTYFTGNSNEEHRQINRAANMRPYIVRVEKTIDRMLPGPQFVKLNIDATIRIDIKTRTEVLGAQIKDGRKSVNEARALEDEPPVDGGDFHNVPSPMAGPVNREEGNKP